MASGIAPIHAPTPLKVQQVNASGCTDTDGDGITDGADNCPSIANSDQADADSDTAGDVCDTDDDGDGIADGADNCPLVANSDQANADGDSFGDVCDADDDGDGIADVVDNCPLCQQRSGQCGWR